MEEWLWERLRKEQKNGEGGEYQWREREGKAIGEENW